MTGELLDDAVRYVSGAIDWFRPASWERHLGIRRSFWAQPILELLLTARCAAAGGQPLPTSLVANARDIADAVLDAPEVAEHLRERGPHYEEWLFLLGLSGRSARDLQRALDADPGPDLGPDEHPVSAVARRYVLDLAGLRHPMPPMAEVASAAMALLDRDVAGYDEMDVYGFTHLVLYATDVGAVPAPFDTRPARRVVRELLPGQIGRDHDVTAELLTCASLLGMRPDPLLDAGWAALRAAQHADGAVPSPPYDPANEAAVPAGRAREGYRFATRYHTTLVTIMAATAAGASP